jgi:hypothetical protein
MKSEQFHRKGFKEVRDKVEATMGEQFESTLVKDLKSSNYVVERDGVRVHLAKVCIGVLISVNLSGCEWIRGLHIRPESCRISRSGIMSMDCTD